MSIRVQNAKGLYLKGIKDGNYKEAMHEYTGDKYIQHSTGVKDGHEGFIEFFEEFVQRNPIRDIEIVRSFEDGKFVFLQVFQSLNNGETKWVTTDFFDTDDNEKIIEHWDVITEYYTPNVSGTDSINGATEILDLDKTDSNKIIVRNLIEKVLKPLKYEGLEKYISVDLVEHHLNAKNSLFEFRKYLSNGDSPIKYDELVLLVGKGNFVSTLSRVYYGSVEMCQTDIFRISDDKVVEHWINAEVVSQNVLDYNLGKF